MLLKQIIRIRNIILILFVLLNSCLAYSQDKIVLENTVSKDTIVLKLSKIGSISQIQKEIDGYNSEDWLEMNKKQPVF